jgi:D-alanyl-D-alanine carboxypeptidase/D-alanyl-D-alanine-endopeptidase (penicillin-binding protein 4)
MVRMTRRRLPVVAVLALVLAAPAGAGDSPLTARLARALAVPHVSQARTGAVAFDLQTGETLFSEHDALPLAPASNEKLAVAYASLVTLGAGYRIETDVMGRGEQDGTVWRGSLVLVGHGDPTLSVAALTALARQVRAAGIRRVTRGVFGDESFFERAGPAAAGSRGST